MVCVCAVEGSQVQLRATERFRFFCADRLQEVVYVAEERTLREMAMKVHPVSTLNPNAPLFVPAAYRVVEDFSSEWWNLVQTCPDFREQWVRERLPALEQQEMFEADLEEIADLDEFLEFQDELQEMEAAQESLHFDVYDGESLVLSMSLPCATILFLPLFDTLFCSFRVRHIILLLSVLSHSFRVLSLVLFTNDTSAL